MLAVLLPARIAGCGLPTGAVPGTRSHHLLERLVLQMTDGARRALLRRHTDEVSPGGANQTETSRTPHRWLLKRVKSARQHSPVAQSLIYALLAGLTYWGLSYREAVSHSVQPVAIREWAEWKTIAALTVSIAIGLSVAGVAILIRVVHSEHLRITRATALLYGLAAVAVCGGLAVLFGTQSGMVSQRDWPVADLDTKFVVVTVIVTLCTAPWIAMIWVVHNLVRRDSPPTVKWLFDVWHLMMQCAETYALFIVLQVLCAGALRRVWLTQAPTDQELSERFAAGFPSIEVLLTGAFGAVLGLLLFMPIVAGWRSSARTCVDRHFSLQRADPPKASWVEGRDRLEKLLHLNVGMLRSPLLALSVLTPLVTSALAVFLPELLQ